MPTLKGIDHIHVYVPDRDAAAAWFGEVLGFRVVERFRFWAEDPGGPLTIEDASGRVHLALFARDTGEPQTAVAFGADGADFLQWKSELEQRGLVERVTDHTVAWSLYFRDPWRNLYEITTEAHAEVSAALG